MLKSFISTKPVAPLGAEFHYASQAYSMLGMIVNKISGEPLAQFVDEHCFRPAGMTQASYIDNSAIIPERAQGYRHVNGATLHGWFLGQYLHARPDVGILSTSRDLAKWAIALEQGKIVRDPSKLWQWTVSDTGKPLDYSYGWFVGTDNGHLMYGHSGGFRTGFHTLIRRYPDDGIDIVTMTNTDDSEAATINEFIATQYIPGWLSGVDLARKPDTNPQETAACINALKSLAVGKIDDAVMLPDALGPATISDTADFYKDQQTYTFSGRATLTHPMTVHGHRLERYTRITSAQGTRNHVTTLYWDDLGRIALVEPTS
jgi:CubicO group peptidase (beta-lactamase class C family)